MSGKSWLIGFSCGVYFVLVSGVAAVRAQEKQEAAPATASAAATQNKAAFQAKFAEYKAAIGEIEKLQAQFQTATPAQRQKLNEDLTGHLAKAQSTVNAMVEAAEAAYREAPNADPEITNVLVSVAKHYAVGRQINAGSPAEDNPRDIYYPIDGGDQYERALPIVKLLIDGGATNNDLYLWGFLCAYMTNDYDLAATYLEKAKQNGAINTLLMTAQKGDNAEREAGWAKNIAHLVSTCAENLAETKEMWEKETAIREAEKTADDLPRVKLTTTKGEIVLELYENEAPQTVANFLTLVKQGFYNGSPFHRVLPNFMAQGGAQTEDGQGGPGYTIRCECYKPDYRRHFRGTLSMAHAGRDTGNSQFFLTFIPTEHLNGRHTAFGRVIEGMEVLGDLQRRSPQHERANAPKPDKIIKAEVVRDRGHEYKFEKLGQR